MTPTQSYWRHRPVVYRVFDTDGRLIYIGASHELPARMKGHELRSWWYGLIGKVRVQVFPDKVAALAAEAVAIQEEQPAFNVRHSGRAEGDYSTWTSDDLRACKAWRDADGTRRGLQSLPLWRLLEAVA